MPQENYAASSDVLAAHLPGEAVLLDMETKNYFRLNETAAWIWRELERGQGRSAILASLLARYDVGEADADAELSRILDELAQRGLVKDGPQG